MSASNLIVAATKVVEAVVGCAECAGTGKGSSKEQPGLCPRCFGERLEINEELMFTAVENLKEALQAIQ